MVNRVGQTNDAAGPNFSFRKSADSTKGLAVEPGGAIVLPATTLLLIARRRRVRTSRTRAAPRPGSRYWSDLADALPGTSGRAAKRSEIARRRNISHLIVLRNAGTTTVAGKSKEASILEHNGMGICPTISVESTK